MLTERDLREIADRHCASGQCDTHPCDVTRLVAEIRRLLLHNDGSASRALEAGG